MKLGFLAAACLAGVYIGLRLDAAVLPVLLLLLATLPAVSILVLYRRSHWPLLLAAVLMLALLRVEATQEPMAQLSAEDGEAITLLGRVIDDPEATAQRIKMVIDVAAVDRGNGLEPLRTKALVYAEPPDSLVSVREPPYFRYGDNLFVAGRLQRADPLAEFDYLAHLANQGISGIIYSREVELAGPESESNSGWRGPVFDLRRKLSQKIEDALPVRQAAVARALLLGQRAQLPDDLTQDFRDTGTAHLLAISGLHVGALLVIMLAGAGALLGRRWITYLLITLGVIWLYALISGLPLSVVRAAIMGTVYLAALALGRPRSVLPALSLSAAVMVVINPQVLQQVSFQLSFAAMAGIALGLHYQLWFASVMGRKFRTTSWGTDWFASISAWLS